MGWMNGHVMPLKKHLHRKRRVVRLTAMVFMGQCCVNAKFMHKSLNVCVWDGYFMSFPLQGIQICILGLTFDHCHGILAQRLLETVKVIFIVSCGYQGCHPHDFCITVYSLITCSSSADCWWWCNSRIHVLTQQTSWVSWGRVMLGNFCWYFVSI